MAINEFVGDLSGIQSGTGTQRVTAMVMKLRDLGENATARQIR